MILPENLSNPQKLLTFLLQLREDVYQEGREAFCRWRPAITHQTFLFSALNLAFYLALRRRDLRSLQMALIPWGLSSLGRSEARTLSNLDAVIATLGHICGKDSEIRYPPLKSFFRGERLLARNTRTVLGAKPLNRNVRIMVTLPTEAAYDYDLLYRLMRRGMNCARINCAHDSEEKWTLMIENIRRAEEETGNECKILMDLAGPKIRVEEIFMQDPEKTLFPGDRILLLKGEPWPLAAAPMQITCSISEIFTFLQVGQSIWIDDGKIGSKITEITPVGAWLEVTHAKPKGERLRKEKGLNFPNTSLSLSPLTKEDLANLDFVAQHADAIGYSFVKEAADIHLLQEELTKRLGEKARSMALIAKIETHHGVENLVEIIVAGASRQPFGVMIARGDLAVEVGYQRLAEIQEQILWICEAAHVPVIWATQVLERLVKRGIPSRAEITDAAMAERAECVMLNKGPFIQEAVTALDDVLSRMEAHQWKKTPRLRALGIARKK